MTALKDRPAIHAAKLMGVLAGLRVTLSDVGEDEHEQAHAAIKAALKIIDKAQDKANA